MTVAINIKSNVKEVNRKLGLLQKKHLPLIVSDSLNEVGVKSVNALRSQFAKKLDRPKPDTIKSPILFKAKPNDLAALVFIKDEWDKGKAPAEYLQPVMDGGIRTPDKEYLITPNKHTKTNKFGNITKANRLKYFDDKEKFFIGIPKGFPNAGFGVWERYGRGSKGTSGGYRIRKVVNLAKSQRFAKRFDFFKTVQGVVTNNMTKTLDKNMKRILSK